VLRRCNCETGKQVFERAYRIARVTNPGAAAKNIHKKFTFDLKNADFQTGWTRYGDK
jgi:hypothetical protein